MPERRLNTIQDLRRYLAGLINRTEAGKIEANLARRLTWKIKENKGDDLP